MNSKWDKVLGAGKHLPEVGAQLQAMKRLNAPRGSTTADAALIRAAAFAQKNGIDAYVWCGNQYMNAVWLTYSEKQAPPVRIELSSPVCYRVTSDLEVYRHEFNYS